MRELAEAGAMQFLEAEYGTDYFCIAPGETHRFTAWRLKVTHPLSVHIP